MVDKLLFCIIFFMLTTVGCSKINNEHNEADIKPRYSIDSIRFINSKFVNFGCYHIFLKNLDTTTQNIRYLNIKPINSKEVYFETTEDSIYGINTPLCDLLIISDSQKYQRREYYHDDFNIEDCGDTIWGRIFTCFYSNRETNLISISIPSNRKWELDGSKIISISLLDSSRGVTSIMFYVKDIDIKEVKSDDPVYQYRQYYR